MQASEAGTSHIQSGRRSDDSCFAEIFKAEALGQTLLAFVSDGAGSASHAADGANLACERAVAEAKAWLQARQDTAPTLIEVRQWVDAVRTAINLAASEKALTPRDYACTFVGVVVTPKWTCYLQIGDGGIVVEDDDGFRVAHWPESGEYANQTYFLTDQDALERLMFGVEESTPKSIALFSDGMQTLVLDYAKRAPVTGFFGPLTKELRTTPEESVAEFECRLQTLLRSEAINKKTDDDKTLVICVREAC